MDAGHLLLGVVFPLDTPFATFIGVDAYKYGCIPLFSRLWQRQVLAHGDVTGRGLRDKREAGSLTKTAPVKNNLLLAFPAMYRKKMMIARSVYSTFLARYHL